MNRGDLPVSFLISIREDALARLDRFKDRVPNLLDNYVRIDRLDEKAAREAIVRPIEQYNRLLEERRGKDGYEPIPVAIEPGLVEEVLEQIKASTTDRPRGDEGVV